MTILVGHWSVSPHYQKNSRGLAQRARIRELSMRMQLENCWLSVPRSRESTPWFSIAVDTNTMVG